MIALVVLLIASPVLYILSAGPALWLVNHGYLDGWTYFRIYRPVSAFAYNHPQVNDAMNRYLSWWGDPVDLSP